MNPDPNLNPYSPPESDTNGATWPEQNAADGDVKWNADRGSRLGAAIIDGLLYVAACIPAIVIVALSGGKMDPYTMVAIVFAIGILPLAIFQWYRVATTGQTLAKKWLRIRVVKLDGSPVDFMSGVFLRLWVPWLILQGVGLLIMQAGAGANVANIFGLVDVLWIFGAPSRCVHDYIAGTKVVVA